MSNFNNLYKANISKALFALSLDPQSGDTLQTQLLLGLKTVLSNQAHAGCPLPASRVLAAELSVSRTTVQAVYDQLLSEGYLVARRGSGTFVADDLPHLKTPEPKARPHIPLSTPWVPFQTGLPDQTLLPHRLWAKHLERAWRHPEAELLDRPDPLGWYPLRVAISEHLETWRQLSCDPEQVVITSGAWEAMELIFRGVLPDTTRVAVEDPCWPKIHDMMGRMGITTAPARIDSEGFDAKRIHPDASAVIVTPARHYPTGINMPVSRRMALIEWARVQNGIIIDDDYDSEFRYRGQPLPSLAGMDGLQNSIYLGSFSKLISASIRLGYVVLPKPHLETATRYLSQSGPRASLVPQPALASFMQGGEFAVHLRRMRRIYAKRQTHLLAALQPLSEILALTPDPSGMHLCLSFREGRSMSDTEVKDLARRYGLGIDVLSTHSVLAPKPNGLLLGYAAFSEDQLSAAAGRLIDLFSEFGYEAGL